MRFLFYFVFAEWPCLCRHFSRYGHQVVLLECCFRVCKYCINSVRDIITFSQSNLYLCYVLRLMSEVNTGVPQRLNAQKKKGDEDENNTQKV